MVTTPHGKITITHTSSVNHPIIHMAAICTKGEEETLDGTRMFWYVMHTRQTAIMAEKCITDLHSWIVSEMCKCEMIEARVHGCKAYIMLDTGSTGNFVSPAFAKVTEVKTFPLEQQLTLQLGCIGSHSKITHWSETTIELGSRTSTLHLDVANIDRYDCILEIPFLQGCNKVILNLVDLYPDWRYYNFIPRGILDQ